MNTCKWETCQEQYDSAKALFEHVTETHINIMGTQKFTRECKWDGCDSKVERRHHLVSHVRIHVNFKPFVCQFCGKSYKWAHDSKRHVRKCSNNPDMKGPLSAPPNMTSMSPFSPSSHSQMMSPVDYMRSPLDQTQQWNRVPFPVLNFQNMNMGSHNQMMMPSPTTPPNMQPMSQYKDESHNEFDYHLKQQQPLTVQIPQDQKFENMPFF